MMLTLYMKFVYNMSHFMTITLYRIEPAKESATANTTEGYNPDKLPIGHQV